MNHDENALHLVSSMDEREADRTRVAIVLTSLSAFAAHVFFALVYANAVPLVSGGRDAALEFYSCYVIALSLSIDNLLAFYFVFKMFRVPWAAQRRALVWGVIGAVLLRAMFIVIGSVIVKWFAPFVLLLAVALALSGCSIVLGSSRHLPQLCRDAGSGGGGGGGSDGAALDSTGVIAVASLPVRWVQRCAPRGTVSETFDGDRFFVRRGGSAGISVRGVRWQATPLFLAVLVIECVDIFFAVDAVPAGLGISTDGLIVWSANLFAVISLRSLFLVVSKVVDKKPVLQRAMGGLLVFIGLRIALGYFDVLHIDTYSTFVVVAVVVSGGVVITALSRRADSSGASGAAGHGGARPASRGEYSVVGLFPSPALSRRGEGRGAPARGAAGAAAAAEVDGIERGFGRGGGEAPYGVAPSSHGGGSGEGAPGRREGRGSSELPSFAKVS